MSESSKKVIFAALAGNLLIALTKFVAAVVTGSSAMFSEGIHSVVDTGNQILLLYGFKRAKLPADEQFPFGHGKEVYFWSFVVALLVFSLGAGVSVYEGVMHILDPAPISNPSVNYIVLALGLLFEGASWLFALTEFTRAKGKWTYVEAVQRGKDPSLFMVVFEDSAAILGLLVALAGVFLAEHTGLYWIDGAASVVIGLILAATAAWLAYETKGLLIGEAANRSVVRGVREIAANAPEVERVNEILTMHMGPNYILVNLSVKFVARTPASQLEAVIASLDQRLKEAYPQIQKIFVEAESWLTDGPVSGDDRR